MGDGCLNNEHFEELGGILKGKLEEHFKNQQLRQGEFLMFVIYLFFNKELNMLLIMYKPPQARFCSVLLILCKYSPKYFRKLDLSVHLVSQLYCQIWCTYSLNEISVVSDPQCRKK